MPLEPCLLKYCWAGAKKIGKGWSFFVGASILLPPLLLLPAAVVVVAAVIDLGWLIVLVILKSRAAKKLAADERRKKQEAERRQIEERERRERLERERPPEPTVAEKFAAAKKRYDDTRRELEAAGLDPVMLGAALRKAKMRYLNELDRLL